MFLHIKVAFKDHSVSELSDICANYKLLSFETEDVQQFHLVRTKR